MARGRRLVRGLALGVPCAASVGGENGTLVFSFLTPCLFLHAFTQCLRCCLHLHLPTVYVLTQGYAGRSSRARTRPPRPHSAYHQGDAQGQGGRCEDCGGVAGVGAEGDEGGR